jgi:hypothetical protein
MAHHAMEGIFRTTIEVFSADSIEKARNRVDNSRKCKSIILVQVVSQSGGWSDYNRKKAS